MGTPKRTKHSFIVTVTTHCESRSNAVAQFLRDQAGTTTEDGYGIKKVTVTPVGEK